MIVHSRDYKNKMPAKALLIIQQFREYFEIKRQRRIWVDFIPRYQTPFYEMTIYVATEKSTLYDGMQALYDSETKVFEIAEYMAGPKGNEVHVFTRTRSISAAIKSLALGNKSRKPIKIWK